MYLKGVNYVTLFAIVCLCINWILKMKVQVCYFRPCFRHGNRLLSSVSTNGKGVCGLKLFYVAYVASVSVASVSRRFLLTWWSFSKLMRLWLVVLIKNGADVCKSESPLKLLFTTIFVCVRSALVPCTDITLKKKNKPSSSQFSHCSTRRLKILHVCFFFFRRMLF